VTPGRNEPCWCGSGKKYKKCHLTADEEERSGRAAALPQLATGTGEKLEMCTGVYEPHGPARRGEGLPKEAADRIVLEHLEKHYSTWPDIALPALEGRTPREAGATAEGRARLEELLRDFENSAERERLAGRAAYDFSKLRLELGLG
jgi:hypothetical protein